MSISYATILTTVKQFNANLQKLGKQVDRKAPVKKDTNLGVNRFGTKYLPKGSRYNRREALWVLKSNLLYPTKRQPRYAGRYPKNAIPDISTDSLLANYLYSVGLLSNSQYVSVVGIKSLYSMWEPSPTFYHNRNDYLKQWNIWKESYLNAKKKLFIQGKVIQPVKSRPETNLRQHVLLSKPQDTFIVKLPKKAHLTLNQQPKVTIVVGKSIPIFDPLNGKRIRIRILIKQLNGKVCNSENSTNMFIPSN
ncbi:hypothetical protein HDV02_006029 [Globomyces sp. JEL0801]|nr:hypothetical protein HDV02_006029 [Globomyces sp. JEL0801]